MAGRLGRPEAGSKLPCSAVTADRAVTLKRLSAAGTTILLLPLAARSLVPSISHHHHLPPATTRRSRGSALLRPFLFSSGISFCLLASAALSGFGTRTVSSSRKVPTYLDRFSRLARDAWECERVSLHQPGVRIVGGFLTVDADCCFWSLRFLARYPSRRDSA